MVAQLLLGLSILVGLHEMGHLLAAKAFGMRVEQFSIGFPPKIFSFKYGETEYSLSAIPLGGFVKISGMIDESLDTRNLSAEPEPYEFRAKPAWQRLIVMMGGIIVNVITGIIIFILIVFAYGDNVIPKEQVNEHGIVAGKLAEKIGLQTGDRIINVNGQDYQYFDEVRDMDVFLESNSYYTIERNGEIMRIDIPANFMDWMTESEYAGEFIDFAYPFVVEELSPQSPADMAGIQKGDRIIAFNDEPVEYYYQMLRATKAHANKEVRLTIDRDGELIKTSAMVTDDGTLGYYAKPLYEIQTIKYSFAEAIPLGTYRAFNVVWGNIKAFGKIFRGEVSASKSLSGPIGIAKVFGGTWDWSRFWYITGLLSMILAFMNFLPIPALDGGHVMFLVYEMVSGRKPSDKFLENAQKVGMVLLLTIMAYAIFNDIWKLF